MVTLNALAAADSVIIPVQAQYLPAKGMTQLMQTIGKVRQYINPSLRIDGILLNIVDNRTNLAKSTADALRKNFGSVIKIYRSSIPMAVKAAEVASKGADLCRRFEETEAKLAALQRQQEKMKADAIAIGGMMFELGELTALPLTFDEKLWNGTVDHVTVHADERVVFRFKAGKEIATRL